MQKNTKYNTIQNSPDADGNHSMIPKSEGSSPPKHILKEF
jgi:hypothetical protein